MEALFQVLVEYVFVGTARLVLPILTFGKCRVREKADKSLLPTRDPFLRREADGAISLNGLAAIFAGLFIWIVVVCVLVAL